MFFARLFLLFVVGVFVVLPQPVEAQEHAKPSMDNIVKTLIRMRALDISRDDVVDLYARVTNCKLYQENYRNDFEWEKIRSTLRKEIERNIAVFPVSYAYETKVQLERYNFDEKLYPFKGIGGQINVNTFSMEVTDRNYCSDEKNHWLPTIYQLVLDKPIKLPGLHLNEEEGSGLLQRMNDSGNAKHIVYMRVNLRVVFVAGLASRQEITDARRKQRFDKMAARKPVVLQEITGSTIQMDSRLESIDFYEDKDYKKLIYTFWP